MLAQFCFVLLLSLLNDILWLRHLVLNSLDVKPTYVSGLSCDLTVAYIYIYIYIIQFVWCQLETRRGILLLFSFVPHSDKFANKKFVTTYVTTTNARAEFE